MRILIAPDSFKESLTATEVAHAIERGILNYRNDIKCIKVPLADGGEGTVEAILNSTGGRMMESNVKDPLLRDIKSFWGLLPDNETAVLEMAAASGLELLSPEERNPGLTSTFGTGQLIRTALDHGCRKIYIGIGGSATNDGGAGMARALGARLLDRKGHETREGGLFLRDIDHIDLDAFDSRIRDSQIIVISDVRNPLIGKDGATRVYAPQKGADRNMIDQLEDNLTHFGQQLEAIFKKNIVQFPGAGAAGGLGAGLRAFCDAELRGGFETVSDLLSLEKMVDKVDLVITGEGKMDAQTKFGKVPAGIARLAGKYNKPVIGIAGSLGEGYQELYEIGFQSLVSISEKPESLEYMLKHARPLLINTAERIIRLIYLPIQKK